MSTKKGLVVLCLMCLLIFSAQLITAEDIEPLNGPEYQTEDQTQEQNQEQNGTCNMTQEQELTQNGSLEQEREQNGTSNMTQEQKMSQNGSLEQEREQIQIQNETKEGEPNSKQKGQEDNLEMDKDKNYQWRHVYRNKIQEGIENQTVVMECNLTQINGRMYVNSYDYQKGMTLEIKEQSEHKLQVKVSAKFKEGKVLVLNVNKSAFKIENSQKLMVKFDGKEINKASIEDVINGNKTEAQYAAAIGEDGGQFVVYIPHFSEHLISFEIVNLSQSQSIDLIIGAVGIALLTILLLVLWIVRTGKYSKD